jgi:hypothetical protein
MRDLPVACTLTPDDLRTRRAGLLPGLMRLVRHAAPLAYGYRYQFDATSEALTAIAHAIDAERQCCRFLRFHLVVEPDGGPIALEVTGPPGTREFLADLAANAGEPAQPITERAEPDDPNLTQA